MQNGGWLFQLSEAPKSPKAKAFHTVASDRSSACSPSPGPSRVAGVRVAAEDRQFLLEPCVPLQLPGSLISQHEQLLPQDTTRGTSRDRDAPRPCGTPGWLGGETTQEEQGEGAQRVPTPHLG